jgi:rhodanese-related sulfurtransferase
VNVPWWLPFGGVPEVSARALHEGLSADAAPQLLDVRSGVEFAGGHIEGALHVPVTALQARMGSLGLDHDRRVVAICLSAHRSPPAVRLLRAHGYDAVQLRGGMMAWRLARLPEVRR